MARKNKINITASWRSFLIIGLLSTAFASPAMAAYMPFNTKVSLNIGIGTSSPGSNLSVLGSESLGSYATNAAPTGGLIASGNVGIGTAAPTGKLEIEGGNVGIGTWTVPDGGTNNTIHWGNVGIGTTKVGGTGEAALSVMNGNVGIGSVIPGQLLDVQGTVRSPLMINPNDGITASGNAATCPVNYKLCSVTNNSAATATITLATAGAIDGQVMIVRFYDFSAVSETLSWVNTENSGVSVPATSNGSTTLPITAGFMYNGQTSKWRCVAVS